MNRMNAYTVLLLTLLCLQFFAHPASAQVVINEILADPATDLTGDANGDGVRSASDDEFVELINNSGAELNISGWTLSDGVGIRHTFPAGTLIPDQCAVVVFGGGSPSGSFGGSVVQIASTGRLGLNNSLDTITLSDGTSEITSVTYGAEGGSDESLVRDPEITGSFVRHSEATGSGGAIFSPGTTVGGAAFSGCSTSDCSITDLVAGEQTACDPQTNTYSQQIIVSFDNPPSSGTLVVNGQSFALGSSPQTVTLTGLIADENVVDVSAHFSAEPGCALSKQALFTAPASCLPLPTTDVIINEIDSDSPGSDTMEFIELFDGGSGNTNLSGLALVLFNGSDDASYAAFDLDGFSTDNDGFFVIGNAATPNVDFVISNGSIQNGADAVALFFGDDTDFPNDTPVTSVNLVDAIVYGTGDPEDSGLLPLLNAGQSQLDENANGKSADESLQRIPNGSGGARNTQTYLAIPPTPGSENTVPVLETTVLINEVDADTPGSDTMEFIELFDGGAGNTDLAGLVVVLFNGADDASYAAFDLDDFSTDADGFFVLGNEAVSNVGLVFSNGRIQNGPDAVALYFGDSSDFPNDTPVTTNNLVDALVYDTGQADDTGLLNLLNEGEPQVDESAGGDLDGHSNQRVPNGTGGTLNTKAFTPAPPTPGQENQAAPSIPCDLTVTPVAHDFGDVEVGSFAEVVITLSNSANSTENCSGSADLSGDDRFSIVKGATFDLAPGSSHEIVVRFDCRIPRDPSATITISSNDPAGEVRVELVGNCVQTEVPDIAAEPEGLNFGRVVLGSHKDKTFVLRNVGIRDLVVTDARPAGSHGNDFQLLNVDLPFSLAPEKELEVTVRFTPNSLDNRTGRVKITSNDPDENLFIVRFRGHGRDPADVREPNIEVSPSRLDFGQVLVGQEAQQMLTVSNRGPVELEVTATDLSGPDSTQWQILSGAAPFTVAPEDSALVNVAFRPTTVGQKMAAISIASNDWGKPLVEVPLTGTGVDTLSPVLVINEIDSDTPGVDMMEFVELFDGGTGQTELSGLVVVFYNGSDNQSYAALDLDGFSTDDDGFFVLGNESVTNTDLVFRNNLLQNGPDAVALYLGDAADFPNDTPISTTNLLDAVVYDTDDDDDDELLSLLNAGQPQVDEDGNDGKDTQSLQRIPNGSGGLRNTTTFMAASPTPGTFNVTESSTSEALQRVTLTFTDKRNPEGGVTFDAYLDSKRADYNMGATKFLRVGSHIEKRKRTYCSVIKFDCLGTLRAAGVTEPGQIIDAWLQLYVFRGAKHDEDGFAVDLYRLNRDWEEGGSDYDPAKMSEVTWSSAKFRRETWGAPGAQQVSSDREPKPTDTQVLKRRGRVKWNVRSSLREMLQGGQNNGWLLQAHDVNTERYFRLASSEHPRQSWRPKLTIVVNAPVAVQAQMTGVQGAVQNPAQSQLPLRSLNEGLLIAPPTRFTLAQNYPNPFNPETRIRYELPVRGFVTLTVFNLRGEVVVKLLDEQERSPGVFSTVWDGRNRLGQTSPSGTYFYRISIRSASEPRSPFVETRKMILLR